MTLHETIHADRLHDEGVDGHGIGVALVDTGVTPVNALRGRVRSGIDLAGAGTTEDAFGHGTALAGIVAGGLIGNRAIGVAPGAHVVPVRVAGPDGATDISNVLAALQWVVSFASELDVRIVTLPYGVATSVPWEQDVLAYAVGEAWNAGLVVVTSVGNRGPQRSTVPRPADVAWCLAPGAADTRGTADPGDDQIASFSSRGPVASADPKPDVLAPGVDVTTLLVSGSFVDRTFPNAAIDHQRIRASSSSFAAGVVAGACALLLDTHPEWSPHQVREALRSTAARRPVGEGTSVGRGVIDVRAAAQATPPADGEVPRTVRPSDLRELGASRGDLQVSIGTWDDPTILDHRSALTAQGQPFDVVAYVEDEWNDRAWKSSQWADHDWSVPRWFDRALDQSWYGVAWG